MFNVKYKRNTLTDVTAIINVWLAKAQASRLGEMGGIAGDAHNEMCAKHYEAEAKKIALEYQEALTYDELGLNKPTLKQTAIHEGDNIDKSVIATLKRRGRALSVAEAIGVVDQVFWTSHDECKLTEGYEIDGAIGELLNKRKKLKAKTHDALMLNLKILASALA